MKLLNTLVILGFVTLFSCSQKTAEKPKTSPINFSNSQIQATNKDELPLGEGKLAIVGGTLIDGNGGEPVSNSLVIINGNTIEFVGTQGQKEIPSSMEVFDAKGMTLMPGLIDAHYHNGYDTTLAVEFLKRGVTSLRDPGAWMDFYEPVRKTGKIIPRLFLTGPHIDCYPPAHPNNSYLIKDALEGSLAVEKFVDQGATAIKVYYGLSIGMIKAICNTAHKNGIPVTGHLETADAGDAIRAGMDGIEHVTSLGTALAHRKQVEKYKQLIQADNEARERGRYEMWNALNFETNDQLKALISLMVERGTFLSPTLAIFEKQYDKGDSTEVNGFARMVEFVRIANEQGVKIVVGSHSRVPYASTGDAYYRELELLGEAGLTNMDILTAATMENARFFKIENQLGSIEKGKIADLILLSKNPLDDIKSLRSIEKVMLNGKFVH